MSLYWVFITYHMVFGMVLSVWLFMTWHFTRWYVMIWYFSVSMTCFTIWHFISWNIKLWNIMWWYVILKCHIIKCNVMTSIYSICCTVVPYSFVLLLDDMKCADCKGIHTRRTYREERQRPRLWHINRDRLKKSYEANKVLMWITVLFL